MRMSKKSEGELIMKAARAIKKSKAILVTAGAGMGVDSGLPDFRGPEGFWKAYPPLKARGLTLPEVSTPKWFRDDPHFAWGFFGHRLQLYERTNPHDGFQILRKWCDEKQDKHFVFTSNVDGHFQKSGFEEDKVFECHGSIRYLQCVDPDKSEEIWPVPNDFKLTVRETDLHAADPLPRGPLGDDSHLARPNILMFSDYGFVGTRIDSQQQSFDNFLSRVTKQDDLVVIELGAGCFVPTVRITSETVASNKKGTLIRINPREPEAPSNYGISIPMNALECLNEIEDALNSF